MCRVGRTLRRCRLSLNAGRRAAVEGRSRSGASGLFLIGLGIAGPRTLRMLGGMLGGHLEQREAAEAVGT